MQPASSKLPEGETKGGRARSISASEQLVRNVIRGLYEGRYVPGQRLVEVDLSQEYNVSRFVVREALARLTAEGAASMSFNRGAVIPRLTRKQTTDIFLVMERVFSLSASLAAEHIDQPGNRELIVESIAHAAQFKGEGEHDFFEFGRAVSHLFRSITKAADNLQLQRVVGALQIHLVRVQFRAFPAVSEIHRIDQLESIAAAILEGDAGRAAERTSSYLLSLSRDIAALPDRVFAA
ncbi:GntR family transcriptional regulator [Novosphingobium beihaiensis]|uniref:GntR family transcriptional regulator n=1 Tax=Novosphingobium beihaiensis TaxID=2930389 RepID=A0ABT0BRE9_9SPHN|nr:GntR family transcriptional regulator [Novosphingobium beihaiensis]MCJ2187633.1 GntR family transcriptional regulator [Novosphingobium beihaiensis]